MKHVTIEDWEKVRFLTKVANVGDSIDDEIINKLLNASSPTFLNSKCLQVGEPQRDIYDPDTNTLQPTYLTFSEEGSNWIYCGCCFKGKNTEPILTI
ncbi:MAG: hypothetical protein HFE57_14100 [Firmicutes bacterium]|jgi:hypothetical protein|nr:hypothetical protein [Bacillota bacterium]